MSLEANATAAAALASWPASSWVTYREAEETGTCLGTTDVVVSPTLSATEAADMSSPFISASDVHLKNHQAINPTIILNILNKVETVFARLYLK